MVNAESLKLLVNLDATSRRYLPLDIINGYDYIREWKQKDKAQQARIILVNPVPASLTVEDILFIDPQVRMQESHSMHRSAENNTAGRTMGDLDKRNALNINKSALEITRRELFPPNNLPFYHILVYSPYLFLTTVFTCQ